METLIQSELLVASFSSIAFIVSFSIGGYVAFKETLDLYRRRKAARLMYKDRFQKVMAEGKQIALEKIKIQAITEKEMLSEQERYDELHQTDAEATKAA